VSRIGSGLIPVISSEGDVPEVAEVGVVLKIQSYDWGTFYADIKAGRFELYGLSWVGLQLPDIFRYAFHSASVPPTGANRGRYSSTEVDALIEAAEASSDVITTRVIVGQGGGQNSIVCHRT
jgi:peptide/nickel transport system substrate-binding protein